MSQAPVMSLTDEMLADLEDIAKEAHIARSGNDWFYPEDCCWWTGNADEGDFMSAASPQTIITLTSELRRLRAENAELAKDAGRYKWLRANWVTMQASYHNDKIKFYTGRARYADCSGSDLDTAIDTAMESAQ